MRPSFVLCEAGALGVSGRGNDVTEVFWDIVDTMLFVSVLAVLGSVVDELVSISQTLFENSTVFHSLNNNTIS